MNSTVPAPTYPTARAAATAASPIACARARRHARRRRLLDHLLVAALHGAVALEQMHGIAVRVGEHLHFDMARPREIFLDQHAVVAEGRSGLALAQSSAAAKSSARSTTRMPLPPPPADGLDQHRDSRSQRPRAQAAPGPGRRRDSRASAARRPFPSAPWRRVFEPMARIAPAGGPMNIRPAAAQASAKSAFSDRKP